MVRDILARAPARAKPTQRSGEVGGAMRGLGRQARYVMREGASGLLALRARVRPTARRDARSGRRQILDHGYLVPTALSARLDQGRHARDLVELITGAVSSAGGTTELVPQEWRARPRLEVSADPSAVWRELAIAGDTSPGLTVQPARPVSAARSRWRHLVGAVVGPDYVEANLPPLGWGSPVSPGGPVPGGDLWLVAAHASSSDDARHLGLDAAVEIAFSRPGSDLASPDPHRPAVDFPVDVVYTWVDCLDPVWRASYEREERPADMVRAAVAESRFNHLDELRYSLRSVAEFAPWVRHIWLVTAGQVPQWLDADDPRITVISHAELWGADPGLPTFNSQAIETVLHRIPGLAEHFVYFNDDVLLGRPVIPETFFTGDGRPKVFPSSTAIPPGEPEASDLAPDAAGKNNRRLVASVTGQTMSAKYQHAPFALRKSVIQQLEQHFAAEIGATRRARFRSISDVTVAGGLHHSFALATDQAVVGDIRSRYVDLESPDAAHLLSTIADYRYYESFCLNVVLTGPRDPAGLVDFLQTYFPVAAEWELEHGQS